MTGDPTPEQLSALPREQQLAYCARTDAHLEVMNCGRQLLDAALVYFNLLRLQAGLPPVTFRIPEEKN